MAYDFITTAEVQQMIDAATAPLLLEINELKRLQDEWVPTKTACKILGVCDDTLAKLRGQDNPIRSVGEGRKRTYSRASLLEYKAQKETPKHKPMEYRPRATA